MPWIQNPDGIEEYKLSIYTKEELPTWDEVYNEFYERFGATFYDPDNEYHTELDPYWKIPRYKYILAIVCNQFNKMIWEDGYKDILVEFLKNHIHSTAVGMRFFIGDPVGINGSEEKIMRNNPLEKEPLIYSFNLPNGMVNPFIIYTNHSRCFINNYFNDPTDKIHLIPTIYYKLHEGSPLQLVAIHDNSEEYHDIINFMMIPFKKYFENGIGWKD